MARFFFHLVDGTDTLLDPDGVEIAESAISANALRQARSIMAGDVVSGKIDFGFNIEVRDENDAIVHSLPFTDAVAVKRLASA